MCLFSDQPKQTDAYLNRTFIIKVQQKEIILVIGRSLAVTITLAKKDYVRGTRSTNC